MATFHPMLWLFEIWQWLLAKLLAPYPPPPNARLGRPKVAVVGAGLTGVSAASHCVGHGFDVVIFEAGPRKHLGGIWSRVNNTSGLQIHSLMYRFHPSVLWTTGYPDRQTIVRQITQLWNRYGLESRTKFNTRITSVKSNGEGRWIINDDPSNGLFDGIIAAVGTCGEPKVPKIPGQERFKGPIYHSSDLDGKDVKDKRVLIVGGGASAVEAMEFVARSQAKQAKILARSEKWIIPRNPIVDMLLAFNIFGQETMLSWIPEWFLRLFFYRGLEDISPPPGVGLFTETPMVNTDVLDQIRSGRAKWLRGDIVGFEEGGIRFNHRAQGVPKNGPGYETLEEGDVVIMATGFKRPSLDFLPQECFQQPYIPPNWYLQCFPPGQVSICANNCTYVNAIGTVGNFHIGVYTRILLMFLVDPLSRPSEYWMKKWIDMTRFVKMRSPTGAFDFFTYAELCWWFFFCVAINPFRWKWALFVFFGIWFNLPKGVVGTEDKIRNGLGMPANKQTHTY